MKKIMFCSSLRKAILAMFAAAVGVECLQAGTIAFYPFTDGDSGSSALRTDLLNSVDPSRFVGTATNWTNMAGVKFSDDLPGRYLFDGSGYKEATYVDSYASIEIYGQTNANGTAYGNSAYVRFVDLAKALSTNSSWTVEFYHKAAIGDFSLDSNNLISFNAGYSFNGVSGSLKINFSNYKGFRGAMDSNYTPGGKTLFYLVDQLTEMRGVWHHFALTYNGTIMTLYHDHASKMSVEFTAGEAAEHAALVWGSGYKHRGKICALRVSDRALKSYEMLHASDNPTLVDRVVWDLPVEGVAGAAVESEHAVAGGGVDPVYAARRQMKVVDDGVVVGITSNCAHLVTTSKASKDETYASGPGLQVLKSSVADRLDGSFTMEGFFKFDATEWERKVGSFVVDGVTEPRIRMTIMGQDWSNGSRNQLWTFGFNRSSSSEVYVPRIDCNYNAEDGTVTAVTRMSSATLTVDGNWHRYVVTYDHSTYTFVCYEDDREILRTTLPGALSFTYQGDWLVGTGIGSHPFEGYVDSIRLSRGVLPTSAFRAMEKVPTGFVISFQ